MKEIWKDIPGYEGCYKVSDLGRIQNIKSLYILKPCKDSKGYPFCALKGNQHRIHRLVASAFLEKYADNIDVDHIDGVRDNNILSNLRMCTSGYINHSNARKKTGTNSRYKGIYFCKQKNKWHARVCFEYKYYHAGFYVSEIAAAKAYDKKAIELFGEFAKTNAMLGLYEN